MTPLAQIARGPSELHPLRNNDASLRAQKGIKSLRHLPFAIMVCGYYVETLKGKAFNFAKTPHIFESFQDPHVYKKGKKD